MKNIKIIVGNIMAFVLLFSINATVFASESDLNKMEDTSLLIGGNCSEISLSADARGNILNQGTAKITDNGNSSVNVFGSVVCDKMILKLTLQRYSDGNWYNIRTFSDTAYNTALLSKSYNVQVTRGYYYRVKAACVAQDGSITESKNPITNGIYIN